MTVKPLNITHLDTALEVLALQHLSYRVEADLIGRDDLPPLLELLEDLQRCGETFFGLYAEDRLAGVIAYKLEDEVLDIHRVMVHPDFFRRGIAKTLLRYVLEQVCGHNRVIVQTGAANIPAKNMYRGLGFAEVEDIEVVSGLWITRFELEKTRGTIF
jgi:ribosomal protein S18 acetylase RimI-like enzyme